MRSFCDLDLVPLCDPHTSGEWPAVSLLQLASESGQEERESAAITRILSSSVNIMSISQSGPLCAGIAHNEGGRTMDGVMELTSFRIFSALWPPTDFAQQPLSGHVTDP